MNHTYQLEDQLQSKDHASVPASATAIVGIACAFPGVRDFNAFWSVLSAGRETITHFTDAQLEAAGVRADRLKAPNYVKSKGVLEGVENFDHTLFNIEADRAVLMDPQHRVFIQKCWEALEDAGYDPRRVNKPIGLFAGSALNTYVLNNLRHADRALSRKFSSIEFLLMTDKDFLTTQTSYLLGLTGPSVTVQTACSTSLTAVHYACESLMSGESDMALAGAVTIYAPQVKGYLYEPDSIISPDGHVRSFDARGGGTVYSSGVAVVVLKRVQDALSDRDHIYALIRSTAVNNDGGRKASFKMPSADGIAEVARDALALAEIPVESIGMIEANGSGTAFGDPIEIEALNRAYGTSQLATGSVPIGSIKSNLGHMNVAAGMGALLKTVASLQRGQVPPSINFETPNPRIQFDQTPFYVCTSLTEWPVKGSPRRAAVNVYGVGGTNAHAILEQAPDQDRHSNDRTDHLLMLSAGSPLSLEQQRTRLRSYLAEHPKLDLGDVAFTLNQGRQQLPFRCSTVVTGKHAGDIKSLIEFPINGQAPAGRRPTCLVIADAAAPAIDTILRARADCPAFSKEFTSIVDEMPELLASIDARENGAMAAFDERRQIYLGLATNIALARMLLDTGLQVNAVYGGGSLLSALVVAGVLSVEDMLVLHRITATCAAAERRTEVAAALQRLRIGVPTIAVYSPVDNVLLGEGHPIQPEYLQGLLLLQADMASLSRVQSEDGYSLILLGRAADAYRIKARLVDPLAGQSTVARSILASAGHLWTEGAEFNLQQYYRKQPRGRVSLPTYAFAANRHWVDIPAEAKSSNYDVAL